MAMNPAVGLDIGNSKCVVAASTYGVVDAVLNEESKRETPAVVHFANKHRLFGTAAASCATAYPASTISQIKRLVGLRFEGENHQKERLLLPYETVESDDNRVSVKVDYINKDRIFTVVDMLAMLFAQIKRTAEHAKDLTMSNCVIGVPSYFTVEQKNVYRRAALIAGWNPLGLLHEGVAAALEYATDRSDDDAPSVVAFVDIGHCDTQITVVRFRGKEMTVLGEVWNSNLGGRDFDEVIFQHFMGVFENQYGKDIRSNTKASVRLRTACEKVKRVLSANKEADVSIDYLMEGVEYASGVITRGKFEELSEGLLRKIGIVFRKVLDKFNVDVNRGIDSVELVGSGSRIPAISRILTGLFKRDLSRTLNGSECVARGCALLCDMLMTSPEDSNTKELVKRMEKRVALYNSTKTDTSFLSQSTCQETDLQNQDRSHERAKDKRNDLESYIYEVRKERNARTTTEAHKEKISEKLMEIEEWLYGEGDDESEDVYVNKLEDLKLFIHRPQVLDTIDVPSQQAAAHSRKNSASDLLRRESPRRTPLKTEDKRSEIGMVEENSSAPNVNRASPTYRIPAIPSKITSNEEESRSHAHKNKHKTSFSLRNFWKNLRGRQEKVRRQLSPLNSAPQNERTCSNATVTEPSNSEQEGLNNIKDTKTECSMPQTNDLSEDANDPTTHTVKEKKPQNQGRSHERAKDKRINLESHVSEVCKERNARSTIEAYVEKISKKLEEIKEWLYEKRDAESEDVYNEKLENLKSFIRGLEVQDTVDVQSQQAPVHSRKKSASDPIKTEDKHSEIGVVEKNNWMPNVKRASPTNTKDASPSKITSNEMKSRSCAHENKFQTRCLPRMCWRNRQDGRGKVHRKPNPPNSTPQGERKSTNTKVTERSNSEQEGGSKE